MNISINSHNLVLSLVCSFLKMVEQRRKIAGFTLSSFLSKNPNYFHGKVSCFSVLQLSSPTIIR